MLKSWSKIVLVSMLVIVIAAPAFATTARVRSMAGTGDYLSDDSNVFRWYSTLPSYANMVQAEIGTWEGGEWLDSYKSEGQYEFGYLWNSRGLGFNYACGEDGKWGTYRLTLNENAVNHPGFHMINPFMYMMTIEDVFSDDDLPSDATQFDRTPVNKWDVAGGWEVGENFVIGAAITRSSVKAEYTAPDMSQEASVSWTTIGLGGTWSNNDNMIADVAFSYGTGGGKTEMTATPTPDPASYEFDKATSMDIAARLFYDWKENVTVIPMIEYGTSEFAMSSTATNVFEAEHGDKMSGMLIGVGMDIEVNGSNTLIFAVEYMSGNWEPSIPDTTAQESKIVALPTIRLALETEITPWLTTRVGAVHHNNKITEKDSDEELIYTNDPNNDLGWDDLYGPRGFEWFLGAGFTVAEWTIDLELAPETPFSLGYWLTGYTAFGEYDGPDAGPVGRISAIYGF